MYVPDDEELRREKSRARELRASQWWKRRLAKGVCRYCGEQHPPSRLTMDHVVPLARGGKSVKGNVVPCCKECNTAKRTLLPSEWAEYLRKKSETAQGS